MNDQIPSDDGTRVYAAHSSTGAVRELTAEDLESLRSPLNVEVTGVQVIDDILYAITWASDYFHDSTRWGEEVDFTYGPLREGENFADLIQSLANDGADEIRKAILR